MGDWQWHPIFFRSLIWKAHHPAGKMLCWATGINSSNNRKNMTNKAPMIKLNNGTEIPVIGLGTWRIEPDATKETIVEAIMNQGYRHLDLAASFLNEDKVGEALKVVYEKSNGAITRKDLYLSSKVWISHFFT